MGDLLTDIDIPNNWKTKRIGSFLEIGSGKDYKHLGYGKIPVYGTGGLMTFVDDYLHDGESVGIGRKGTIDKPVYLKGKFWTVDTLFYTHSFKDSFPKYIYYLFLGINWKRFNEASGVPSLSKKTIELIEVPLPPLPEQQKIAAILSKWDELIEQQTQLIAAKEKRKKGLMQKLLTGEVRFPGFSGEWESVTLGDIGKVKMCKRIFNSETTTEGDIPFYKIGTFGKQANAFISTELYNEYRGKFSFPKKGDVLMSAAGTLGRTVVYNGDDAYFQDSNIVWLDHNNTKIFNEFLFFVYKIIRYESEGGTIQRLYNSIILEAQLKLPSLKEQKKIAMFLLSCDEEIESLKDELKAIQQQKKGLMQQLLTGKIRVKV